MLERFNRLLTRFCEVLAGLGVLVLAVLAVPGIAKPLDFVPADYEQRLIKNDFSWSAKNRDKILAEWLKRYDAKSEAK